MTVKEVDIYEFFKERLLKEFGERYPSRTKIEEHGVFKRTYERKGKRKRQKTERLTKNPKKVVLSQIRDLELYILPYEYPDTVFIGRYPDFTMAIDKHDLPRVFVFFNKMRWYFDGIWQKKKHRTNEATKQAVLIKEAYNIGLAELKEKRKQ